MAASYKRKVSSEEEREGYLLIEKSDVKFFPAAGKQFRLRDEGRERIANVEARPCTCRGPEKPHEHYFVRVPELRAGSSVSVTRDGEVYVLNR